MKKLLSLSLILSLMIPYTLPLKASLALQSFLNEESSKISLDNNQTSIHNDQDQLNFNINDEKSNTDIARNRRDRRNLNRVNNRNRRRDVNRANNQNGRRNLNRVNNRNHRRDVNRANNQNSRRNLNRVNNRNRRRDVNRPNNQHGRRYHHGKNNNNWRGSVHRYNYRNAHRNWRRNIRRDNYRHYPRYHRRNYRRYYNRNYRNYRTIINHPYYNWYDWHWNNGRRWYPDNNYWGGGFWGNFLASMITLGLTSAILDSNEAPKYIIIKENSPGYYLFSNYGLSQVPCDTLQDLVFIYGPQNSLMCAIPNENVPSGYYEVNTESLVLIPIN